MEATSEKIEIVLAEMQQGASVRVGSSRCHHYYEYKEKKWMKGWFDEGAHEEWVCTRKEMIRSIKRYFTDFQPLLTRPYQREIQDALYRDDKPRALRNLKIWEEMSGHSQSASVLRAYLQWPAIMPDENVKDLIREQFKNYIAYHSLMMFVSYTHTEKNGVLGLRYVETLIAIVGPAAGHKHVRASFREMSGDLLGAVEDLEYERATLTEDESVWADNLERQITRLKGLLEG